MALNAEHLDTLREHTDAADWIAYYQQDAQVLAFTKGAITKHKMLACPPSEFLGPEVH